MSRAIIALAFIGVCLFGKKKKNKSHEAKDKTIVDILPMNVIEKIAAETDASSVFSLKSVCKALDTENMQAIGEKLTKDATRNTLFAVIHCVRRFVTLFNDPVVTRKFIADVLRKMLHEYLEAIVTVPVNDSDYRIVEFELITLHLHLELGVTPMQSKDIIEKLTGSKNLRYDPQLAAAYNVLKNYFIGKQQKYFVTLEIDNGTFTQTFVYEGKKLMMYGPIHHSKNETKTNNEHIHHIRKYIPSMELQVSKNKKYPHMMFFHATPENINGFVNMMYETNARGLFDNPDIIVPYMDIYFMNASFNNWFKESFTRHVFSERIEAIHKANTFLGKSWLTLNDEHDRYEPNYEVCRCGKCLK